MDRQKIERYDTENWVYEAEAAPAGLERLTVEFGLVQQDKYEPEVVRAFLDIGEAGLMKLKQEMLEAKSLSIMEADQRVESAENELQAAERALDDELAKTEETPLTGAQRTG